MKKSIVSVTLVGMLALAGCAQAEGSVSDDAPEGDNAGQVTDEEVAAEEPAEEPSEKVQPDPKFGQTYTWDNGLSVTISKPKPYQPSEYAAVDKSPNYMRFEVTIVNKTGAKFDPSGFYTTVQSADREGSEIFDSEKGLDGSPTTTLLDGRQAKFPIGYGVQNPGDLVMDVTAGYDAEYNEFATTFTN